MEYSSLFPAVQGKKSREPQKRLRHATSEKKRGVGEDVPNVVMGVLHAFIKSVGGNHQLKKHSCEKKERHLLGPYLHLRHLEKR